MIYKIWRSYTYIMYHIHISIPANMRTHCWLYEPCLVPFVIWSFEGMNYGGGLHSYWLVKMLFIFSYLYSSDKKRNWYVDWSGGTISALNIWNLYIYIIAGEVWGILSRRFPSGSCARVPPHSNEQKQKKPQQQQQQQKQQRKSRIMSGVKLIENAMMKLTVLYWSIGMGNDVGNTVDRNRKAVG